VVIALADPKSHHCEELCSAGLTRIVN